MFVLATFLLILHFQTIVNVKCKELLIKLTFYFHFHTCNSIYILLLIIALCAAADAQQFPPRN